MLVALTGLVLGAAAQAQKWVENRTQRQAVEDTATATATDVATKAATAAVAVVKDALAVQGVELAQVQAKAEELAATVKRLENANAAITVEFERCHEERVEMAERIDQLERQVAGG